MSGILFDVKELQSKMRRELDLLMVARTEATPPERVLLNNCRNSLNMCIRDFEDDIAAFNSTKTGNAPQPPAPREVA